MTLRFILLASIFSFFTASLLARPVVDSVGVENLDGKKVILHKLEPKDNYFSIGRRYNIKPSIIIKFNSNASMQVGNIIKVPTELPFISTTLPASNNTGAATTTDTSTPATEYRVSAGETLYAIARRFNIKVEDIVSQNSLKTNSLQPGQILKIKITAVTAAPTPVPVVVQQAQVLQPAKRDTALTNQADSSALADRRLPSNRYGITERNEKGVATYMDDAGMGLDPNKKLVLHRTAPVGTVLKITNPMTNRTTFAKVVGRFTENEANKDVVIVLTKSAADALGALDKRFHVNISYGTPNNE
jgi:LysM repeat protein